MNAFYIVIHHIRRPVSRILDAKHQLCQRMLQVNGRSGTLAVGSDGLSRSLSGSGGTVQIVMDGTTVVIGSVKGLPLRQSYRKCGQSGSATGRQRHGGRRPGMEPCRPETDIGRRGAAPTVAGTFGKGGSRGTATGIETTIRSCEVDADAIDPVCTRTDAIDKGTAGDEGSTGMNTGTQGDAVSVGGGRVFAGTGTEKQGYAPKE